MTTEPDQWYSDTALAKQAEMQRKTLTGEPITTDDLLGSYQPRTPPKQSERCYCCNTDAREEVGGNGNYCFICIGRGRHE
jgi:hypothetical protein